MAFIIEIYVVYIKILHKPDTERGTGGTLFRVMGLVCPPRGLHRLMSHLTWVRVGILPF